MSKVVNVRYFTLMKELNEQTEKANKIVQKYATAKNRKMSKEDEGQ